ncbi:hypothetical protein [Anthocerotibacter panamensis]|uniref:hypothetical protein n=1 Tax=Anthocerotibacter panamensis TaxID=2857077 RepID=UPI001C4031F0|nr:hypothetical protein [Anthocerotibacter panamensis]
MTKTTGFYTGIGSREVAPDIAHLLTRIARHLAATGNILRTGGARGVEKALRQGAEEDCEVFLPYQIVRGTVQEELPHLLAATRIAEGLHPDWPEYNPFSRRAHILSVYQLLGADLNTPSDFLLCYAPIDSHGLIQGATRTAVALAAVQGIRCYNLFQERVRWKFRARLDELQP